MAGRFELPDLIAKGPWTRQLSPHYRLTARLGWPKRDIDFLRGLFCLFCLFFAFDEYTDVATTDKVQQLARILVNALHNPSVTRPEGEHDLEKKYFPRKTRTYLHEKVYQRHGRICVWGGYRQSGRTRTANDYLVVRRDTAAIKPIAAFSEFGLNLPVEVLENPSLVSLIRSTVDMLLVDNSIGLSEAVNRAESYFEELRVDFLSKMKEVSSWNEETDRNVFNTRRQPWTTKRNYGDDWVKKKEHRIVKTLAPDPGPVRRAR
ncbi:hypothetical protein BDZ94DRAFT_1296610 [Collybia nuda]|uniref:Uncharacterized protein n=1 Tax=Collybia nuda TaxID=64659 RepID=A0A9P5Y879_9AGAR|nr:hypothetical protein BDZ94DRAFT_1296610 [Collybia nuda]